MKALSTRMWVGGVEREGWFGRNEATERYAALDAHPELHTAQIDRLRAEKRAVAAYRRKYPTRPRGSTRRVGLRSFFEERLDRTAVAEKPQGTALAALALSRKLHPLPDLPAG